MCITLSYILLLGCAEEIPLETPRIACMALSHRIGSIPQSFNIKPPECPNKLSYN